MEDFPRTPLSSVSSEAGAQGRPSGPTHPPALGLPGPPAVGCKLFQELFYCLLFRIKKKIKNFKKKFKKQNMEGGSSDLFFW